MSACYILYSKRLNRFYIGSTHDDVSSRLKKHNEKTYGTRRYTSQTSDWELFLFIETEDYAQAIRVERKIKSSKSSVYIRNLKKYPELVATLLENSKNT